MRLTCAQIQGYVSNVVIWGQGRDLETVYTYLLQNRLTWIREYSAGTDIGDEGVFVEHLEVKERGRV